MTLGILASFTDAWHIAPAGAASKVLAGEPAVRDLIESFAVAWNRGDVEALAVLFHRMENSSVPPGRSRVAAPK